MKWREQIPGGKAKGMKPSDFNARELAKGALEETEEHGDFLVAVEVAMDHLASDPRYYSKKSPPKRRPTARRRKKVTKKVKGSQRVNQLVRDQFRDLYGT
jgi:hypothetical protein